MTHSKGEWKVGNNYGVVVTDDGEGFPKDSGHDATDYYGGFLIAESIAKVADVKLIAAAPDLIDACTQLIWALDNNDEKELENGRASAKAAIQKALL